MQLGSPQKLTRGNANVALMTDKQYSELCVTTMSDKVHTT